MRGKVSGFISQGSESMDFNSTPDCLLFVARVAAAAEYVIITRSSDSALSNAQDLKLLCDRFLVENEMSFTLNNHVIDGWTATVFWPNGALTDLGDEPGKWSVQLTEANWEQSQLRSDFRRAMSHIISL